MSVTDFHTHILPSIDDGSDSVETSLLMLERQMAQGIKKVVVTPHFYPSSDNPDHFLSKRSSVYQKLKDAAKEKNNLPELVLGAEVYFFEGISDCEYLSQMAIENTRCVMIEMPFKHWSDRNLSELVGIKQKLGLVPVLAHVDRYVRPFSYKKTFDRLSGLPVIIQVNSSFFINKSTRRCALKLLKQGKIHILGSDCHNETSRVANIGAALEIIKKAQGEKTVTLMQEFEKMIFEKV